MLSLLKRAYITARELRYFLLRDELGSDVKTSFMDRLRLVPRGYLSQCAIIYDLDKHDLRDYLSDLARIRMGRITAMRNPRAGYTTFLDNKIAFTAVFGPLLKVANVMAFIERGRMIALHDKWDVGGESAITELCKRAGGPLVFKPIAGSKGKDVFFISYENSRLHLNGRATDESAIAERIAELDESIVCEFLQQGEFGSRLHPDSTNTMRIVTMLDPKTHEPFIPIAVQRIGTAASMPVDNWSRGGLSAHIDLDTGELGPGASCPAGRTPIVWHETHPDTGSAIAGERIPQWQRICTDLLAAARRLPYLAIVAWDLIDTADGLAAIETNATTDVDLLQIHKPLLRDPRVRAFFEHHRIL